MSSSSRVAERYLAAAGGRWISKPSGGGHYKEWDEFSGTPRRAPAHPPVQETDEARKQREEAEAELKKARTRILAIAEAWSKRIPDVQSKWRLMNGSVYDLRGMWILEYRSDDGWMASIDFKNVGDPKNMDEFQKFSADIVWKIQNPIGRVLDKGTMNDANPYKYVIPYVMGRLMELKDKAEAVSEEEIAVLRQKHLDRLTPGRTPPTSPTNAPQGKEQAVLQDLLARVTRKGDKAAIGAVQDALDTLAKGGTLSAEQAKAVRWRMHQNGMSAQTSLFK